MNLSGRRPTLADVAAAAGVSQMTVSRALNGRGRIAAATRNRIREIAAKAGYRPDPQIAKLMHHLRLRRRPGFQGVLVGLSTRPAGERGHYFATLVAGAAAQAARRGYRFEVHPIPASAAGRRGLDRSLRSRGVEGIMLLPLQRPLDLSALLPWADYSVVAASASATGPRPHRVIPHHFANTLLLCRRLAARGHRRIGLVISAEQDLRSEHGFTSAVTWHGLNESGALLPPLVTPEAAAIPLLPWFDAQRPDAVIVHEAAAAAACARLLGRRRTARLTLAVTSLSPGEMRPGIDEQPSAIGVAAAEILANLVERGLRGLPDSPASTLLTGRWLG